MRAGRRRHRLRPQRDPARGPGRHDAALMAVVHDGVTPSRRSRARRLSRERRARHHRRRPDGPRVRVSAAARWIHLGRHRRAPARSSTSATRTRTCSPGTSGSTRRPRASTDWRDLLADPEVEAVYCAVPHHLHAELYVAIARGRQAPARREAVRDRPGRQRDDHGRGRQAHPELLVRCSSEMPFFPGGQAVWRWIAEGALRPHRSRSAAQFLHSSDLDPGKPINWKRQARLQRRLRLHRRPRHARAAPPAARRLDAARRARGAVGRRAPSGPTAGRRDGAVRHARQRGAAVRGRARRRRRSRCDIETKRIAPGETNTWTIEVDGTEGSIAFTTKQPKTLRTMDYAPGGPQDGAVTDLGSQSAYPTITGAIFEFGFSDAIQQMWAAFLDELAHGATACAARSAARRPGRRRPRTGSSPPRSSRRRRGRSCAPGSSARIGRGPDACERRQQPQDRRGHDHGRADRQRGDADRVERVAAGSASAAPSSDDSRSLKPSSLPRSAALERSASCAVAATNDTFQPTPSPNSRIAVAKTESSHSSPIVDARHHREAADQRRWAPDLVDQRADDEHQRVHAQDVRADDREHGALVVVVVLDDDVAAQVHHRDHHAEARERGRASPAARPAAPASRAAARRRAARPPGPGRRSARRSAAGPGARARRARARPG